MSQSSKGNTAPKSMRHKQILDVAAENPEASIAELAAEVPSATTDLVERVLEEHGDPAETDDEAAAEGGQTATDESAADGGSTAVDDAATTASDDEETESQSHPTPSELSAAERETIRAIREYPTASQRDLAEKLDVTASTVSNRVNGIDGFDWANRETFANAVLDADEPTSSEADADSADATHRAADAEATSEPEVASEPEATTAAERDPSSDAVTDTITTFQSTVEDLSAQLEDLEGQVETIADGGESPQPFQDPELVHKVVHACMNSENITEEEELQILESLV